MSGAGRTIPTARAPLASCSGSFSRWQLWNVLERQRYYYHPESQWSSGRCASGCCFHFLHRQCLVLCHSDYHIIFCALIKSSVGLSSAACAVGWCHSADNGSVESRACRAGATVAAAAALAPPPGSPPDLEAGGGANSSTSRAKQSASNDADDYAQFSPRTAALDAACTDVHLASDVHLRH